MIGRQIVLLLILIVIKINGFGQDTLLLNSGVKRIVKVQAISSEIIYYYRMNDTLKLLEFPKSMVSMIIYADGMKEEYFRANTVNIKPDTISGQFNLGKYYAKKYYRPAKPFVISFLANTVGSFGVALILEDYVDNDYALLIGPAVTISMLFVKPPSRVAIPDMNMFNNPEFSRGFRKQAGRRKNKAVLLGFASGLAFDFAIIYLFSQ